MDEKLAIIVFFLFFFFDNNKNKEEIHFLSWKKTKHVSELTFINEKVWILFKLVQ